MNIKAKDLQHGNRIKMQVFGSDSTMFFPVERPELKDGKIVCTIHRQTWEFNPEQEFIADDSKVSRDQLRSIHKIDSIEFFGEETIKAGDVKNKVREYVGTSTASRALDGKIVIEWDKKRKVFNIVSMPNWMPQNLEMRRDMTMARTWRGVEAAMRGWTGADVRGKERKQNVVIDALAAEAEVQQIEGAQQ